MGADVMNAELIALMDEFHLQAKTMALLFGVSVDAVDNWKAKPEAAHYRSMDRSPNKATYKKRLKWIRRYLTQIRDM